MLHDLSVDSRACRLKCVCYGGIGNDSSFKIALMFAFQAERKVFCYKTEWLGFSLQAWQEALRGAATFLHILEKSYF